MEEKYMVNDILECSKNSLRLYEEAIIECQNAELRQLFKNLRNNLENYQYELFKIAEAKGYYAPAKLATEQEILEIKKESLE